MTAYESDGFDPPAPVARVTIMNIETGDEFPDVPLLVDTGADATLLPAEAVRAIGVPTVEGTLYPLMGFDGSRTDAVAADLALRFLGKTVRGRFLLIDRKFGILGRDVLNHFRVLFDGPARKWGSPD